MCVYVVVREADLGRVVTEIRFVFAPDKTTQELNQETTRPLSELAADSSSQPTGLGVSTADIRRLAVATLLREIEAHEATNTHAVEQFPAASLVVTPADAEPMGFRNIRDLRSQIAWAQAAVTYTEAVRHGMRAPSKFVAEVMQTTQPKAQRLVEGARSHGYLTRAKRGRPGGEVTESARALLRSLAEGGRTESLINQRTPPPVTPGHGRRSSGQEKGLEHGQHS